MRKKYIFWCILIYSEILIPQNFISDLRSYYYSADKEACIKCLQEEDKKSMDETLIRLGFNKEDLQGEEIYFNFHQDSSILIVNIVISNADNYTYSDNIYDFLEIDTSYCANILGYLNNRMELKTLVYKTSQIVDIDELPRKLRRGYEKIVPKIKKKNPEFLIYCTQLTSPYKTFLFLHNNNIYVYRVNERDFYELNEYIRKFYKESTIRKLSKLKEAFIHGTITR